VTDLSVILAIPIVAVAAVTDVRSGVIPNRLTYPAVLLGLGMGLWPQLGPTFVSSANGLAIAFLPALVLFAIGAIGGGDVKLLAAVGALVGYPSVLDVLFFSIVAGGALALCTIVAKGRALGVLREFWAFLTELVAVRGLPPMPAADLRIPFAAATLAGVVWTVAGPGFRVAAVLSTPGG